MPFFGPSNITKIVAEAGITSSTPNAGTVTIGMADINTGLLGNSGTVASVPLTISLGTNLSFSGNNLDATGGTGGSLTFEDALTTVAAVSTLVIGTGGTITDNTGGKATLTGFGAGASPVIQVSHSLTASDILNLSATPIVLVAAPGAGRFIRFTQCAVTYRHVTTPYTGGGGTALFFNDKSGLFCCAAFAGAFQIGSNRTIMNISNSNATITPAQMDNLPLVIQGLTAFAGGDGTAMLTVDYLLLPST